MPPLGMPKLAKMDIGRDESAFGSSRVLCTLHSLIRVVRRRPEPSLRSLDGDMTSTGVDKVKFTHR
jgi:hypothetical protein